MFPDKTLTLLILLAAIFYLFFLYLLKLSESFGTVDFCKDAEAFMHQEEQATELLRKAAIYHGVQLLSYEIVRVWEQYRSYEVVSTAKQECQIQNKYE